MPLKEGGPGEMVLYGLLLILVAAGLTLLIFSAGHS